MHCTATARSRGAHRVHSCRAFSTRHPQPSGRSEFRRRPQSTKEAGVLHLCSGRVPPGLSTLVGLSEQFRRGLLSEDTGDPTSRARRPRPDAELGAAWARRKRIAGERNGIPAWAHWNSDFGRRYTVGVEEEAMLLDAGDLRLRQCGDAVLSRLSGEIFDHTGLETHAGLLELRTGVHSSVADAIRELAA